MYQYFYRLGHQPSLGIAEFEQLSKLSPLGGQGGVSYTQNYLFSNQLLDISKSGSLVFAGKLLTQIEDFDEAKDYPKAQKQLFEIIQKANQDGHKFKKLGLSLPEELYQNALKIAKSANSKKVNLLPADKLPNFGNWKGLKNWVIGFLAQNTSVSSGDSLLQEKPALKGRDNGKSSFFFGQITQFSQQEFWGNLDSKLPAGTMKRGLINLKLARTLLNLTDKKVIWDPFCGAGRLAISGLDLKEQFILSDLDPNCKIEVDQNLSFAKNFFQKANLETAQTSEFFQLDAQNLSKISSNPSSFNFPLFSGAAIVTEGWLGFNPGRNLIESERAKEWQVTEKIWQKCLQEADKLKIEEIVFCLPFYQQNGQKFLPNFVEELVQNSNYNLIKLAGKNYLTYSRLDSLVGHLVLKVMRK